MGVIRRVLEGLDTMHYLAIQGCFCTFLGCEMTVAVMVVKTP